MAPAGSENPAQEQPPPAKTPETPGATTQQPDLPADPAQGSKRSGNVLDDDKIWDKFAASLGDGTGDEAKFTLGELGPMFEAFKAKRQRTVRNIVGPFHVETER